MRCRWIVVLAAVLAGCEREPLPTEVSLPPLQAMLAAGQGSWTTLAPMPTARTGSAAAVIDGQLFVLTGAAPPGGATTAVEAYDPLTDSWTAKAAAPTARAEAAAGVIDGKVYLVGGCVGSDCRIGTTEGLEAYDPVANSWTTLRPMSTARFDVAVGTIGGKLYVAGGIGPCPPCTIVTTLEAYDPGSDSWMSLAPMPTPRHYVSGAVVDGKLYVVGANVVGTDFVATLDVYDPMSDTWTAKTPMPTPRVHFGVGELDGLIYTVSGNTATATGVTTVEVYDPAADAWSAVAPIPTARYAPEPRAIAGVLYVAGSGAGNTYSSVLEAFRPSRPPGVSGAVLGPDGTSICNSVPPNARLRVDVLIPDFVPPDPAFAAQQFVTCPANTFDIPLASGTYRLRIQLAAAAAVGLLPWRTLDPVPLVIEDEGVLRDGQIAEGIPLGGLATVNGGAVAGVALELAYGDLPRFGAASGRSQADGSWADFFSRSPFVVQADIPLGIPLALLTPNADCRVPGTRMLNRLPGVFRVPADLTRIDCTMETAPATGFSHRANRLLVTPLPGDMGGQSPELFDRYGRGWGAVFPLDPSITPVAGQILSPVLFSGGLLIGVGPDVILSGMNVDGYMACGPAVNAACRDLGLDGAVTVGEDAHFGREVAWTYSDAASNQPLGLRIVQRSYAGPAGRDLVLFRFTMTSTAPVPVTFYAGFFGDWDVDEAFADDIGLTDLDGRLMYLTNAGEVGSHLGTMLLGPVPVSGNFFFTPTLLSLSEQVNALTGGLKREQALEPADYRFIHGAGPITLAPGETVDLWVALAAGGSKAELLENAQAAADMLAPVAVAGGPYAGLEGAPVAFDGTGSFHPAGLPIVHSWAFGDGAAGSGPTPTHSYADDGSYTATLTVSDGRQSADASAAVTIANVAPAVGPISAPVDPVAVNTAVSIAASFADPGTGDTHAATVEWGDGTVTAATVTEAGGSGAIAASHVYPTPGVFTVVVTLTDDDGGVGQSVYQYVVVYDAEGGYVTGSGWITSPAGAYPADPSATGRATFGFFSRYERGATAPSGNAMFLFQAASLRFRSDVFEWLVVAGARAQFKGVGTINGAGDYGFFVAAVDGELNGGGGSDKFRIKIWDRATGVVVYDNQLGDADDATATTVLGGGNIVIHP